MASEIVKRNRSVNPNYSVPVKKAYDFYVKAANKLSKMNMAYKSENDILSSILQDASMSVAEKYAAIGLINFLRNGGVKAIELISNPSGRMKYLDSGQDAGQTALVERLDALVDSDEADVPNTVVTKEQSQLFDLK